MVEVACNEANEDVRQEDKAYDDEVYEEKGGENGLCRLHTGNNSEVASKKFHKGEEGVLDCLELFEGRAEDDIASDRRSNHSQHEDDQPVQDISRSSLHSRNRQVCGQ